MKRRALLLLAVLLAFPLASFAQDAPTPPPDPLVYDDPGMHFHAPDGYRLIAQHKLGLDQLDTNPDVVAAWISPVGQRVKKLFIQQESFDGGLDAFASSYSQSVRDAFGDAVVRNKEPMSLKNGMPAIFIEVTYGSGFDASKLFAVVWVDGSRGCALSVSAAVGEVDATTAKRLLSDASAVRYPLDRG